jgi:hypothetical protein
MVAQFAVPPKSRLCFTGLAEKGFAMLAAWSGEAWPAHRITFQAKPTAAVFLDRARNDQSVERLVMQRRLWKEAVGRQRRAIHSCGRQRRWRPERLHPAVPL